MIRNVDECGYSFKNGSYDGAAGDKDGLIIDGANWLVKYPKNIGNLERTGGASYSTSPLSEYIGSHIFDILGFPVHETMLVERRLKIAVACKDFEGIDERLTEIRTIKNHDNEKLGEELGIEFHATGSSHVVDLNELLLHLRNNDAFFNVPNIEDRFWEQAVVDVFINNNDRNNGNWGIIKSNNGADRLAPVFDNGGCLQTKISEEKITNMLLNPVLTKKNACNTQTAYGENGHAYSTQKFMDFWDKEPGLAKAIKKVVPLIKDKKEKIFEFINGIDEKHILNNGQEVYVCSKNRKDLYILQLQTRYNNLLLPYYEKVLNQSKLLNEGIENSEQEDLHRNLRRGR